METPQQKTASLILQNVEALAENENLPNIACVGNGSVDCPFGNIKVEYVVQGVRFE
ncbi:MAG: NVEALA domain-containing protein [Acinetobacter sp.]